VIFSEDKNPRFPIANISRWNKKGEINVILFLIRIKIYQKNLKFYISSPVGLAPEESRKSDQKTERRTTRASKRRLNSLKLNKRFQTF